MLANLNLKEGLRTVAGVLLLIAFVFFIGSFLISAMKNVSDNCGEHWGAERFVQGDWFCDTHEDCETELPHKHSQ